MSDPPFPTFTSKIKKVKVWTTLQFMTPKRRLTGFSTSFLDLDGNIWNLKTLLSNHTSFKVDIPEVEAQSIPEMNHYFVTWNIYSIPSTKQPERSSISSQPKIGSKVFSRKNYQNFQFWKLFWNQWKLVRSSTQADLMVQYKMEQFKGSRSVKTHIPWTIENVVHLWYDL